MKITSFLSNYNLTNKRVFLRADLNIPVRNNHIVDDYRINAILPTINLIQKKGGKVILGTHIGRPHIPGKSQISTSLLISWFKEHGYTITFEADVKKAAEKSLLDPSTILLLENLRFFPGEKKSDDDFARSLAQLADYYVNDAFALLHRADTSITLLPLLFPAEQRTIGPLIVKELTMLSKLINTHEQPFVIIAGGGKVAEKLPMLEGLLHKADTILLCPAIAFTFAKALGKPVGKSLVDQHSVSLCEQLLKKAEHHKVTILMPIDYQIATGSLDGSLSFIKADEFPNNAYGISIGPETIALFSKKIATAKTIFFNAAMGFLNRKETLQGLEALLKAIAGSEAFSIIGGGESVAAARLFIGNQGFDYLSTGGGAALAYLSGEPMPGLAPFLTHS